MISGSTTRELGLKNSERRSVLINRSQSNHQKPQKSKDGVWRPPGVRSRSAQVSNSVSVDGQLDSIGVGSRRWLNNWCETHKLCSRDRRAAPEPKLLENKTVASNTDLEGSCNAPLNGGNLSRLKSPTASQNVHTRFAKDSRGDYTASGLPLEIASNLRRLRAWT